VDQCIQTPSGEVVLPREIEILREDLKVRGRSWGRGERRVKEAREELKGRGRSWRGDRRVGWAEELGGRQESWVGEGGVGRATEELKGRQKS
jgi:hypothetical protein